MKLKKKSRLLNEIMQYITEIKYHNVQNDPNTECEQCKLQQPVTKILQ